MNALQTHLQTQSHEMQGLCQPDKGNNSCDSSESGASKEWGYTHTGTTLLMCVWHAQWHRTPYGHTGLDHYDSTLFRTLIPAQHHRTHTHRTTLPHTPGRGEGSFLTSFSCVLSLSTSFSRKWSASNALWSSWSASVSGPWAVVLAGKSRSISCNSELRSPRTEAMLKTSVGN